MVLGDDLPELLRVGGLVLAVGYLEDLQDCLFTFFSCLFTFLLVYLERGGGLLEAEAPV